MLYLGEIGSLSTLKSFGLEISEMGPRSGLFLVINKLLSRHLPRAFGSAASILNKCPLDLLIFDSGDKSFSRIFVRQFWFVSICCGEMFAENSCRKLDGWIP
jgi:hypothetical protein